MITTISVLQVNSLNQLRSALSCVCNFSVCKLKIAVTKNYVVVIIHHTQWKNSGKVDFTGNWANILFYVLSATKSVAEGHLTKLKDVYKVTSLSKCMFLKALHLEKGMSGTESLWERIPGCLYHTHTLSFPKRISGSAEVVWGGALFCFPTGCGKSFKSTWAETQLFYWSYSASLQQTAETVGGCEGMNPGHTGMLFSVTSAKCI